MMYDAQYSDLKNIAWQKSVGGCSSPAIDAPVSSLANVMIISIMHSVFRSTRKLTEPQLQLQA